MDLKNADFVACLALYQNRRDTAIGLSHFTKQQKGLIWYYQTLKDKAYSNLISTSFYLGVIKGAKDRIKEITRIVSLSTDIEEARELYREALNLQNIINEAAESLNG